MDHSNIYLNYNLWFPASAEVVPALNLIGPMLF